MTHHMIKRAILFAIALATVLSLHVGGSVAPSQAGGCAVQHTVTYGDTLYRLSIRYGVSISLLQEMNGLWGSTLIYVGQKLCVRPGGQEGPVPQPQPTGTRYIVQPGDSLFLIARRYGIDPYVLARVNNIVNINRIYVGQVLIIPDFTIQAQ
ncbi:MAG: LysM peptidoglycan-binding domain-containing protein [Anaerolineae bacterium]|nr:LysM peptidoglycan-binding domain-containing protein [Anaerolineae bacterium]